MIRLDIEEEIGVCGVKEETEKLAQAAAALPPGHALDMGTGTGYIAIYLARSGFTVDAVDINEKALQLARQNAFRNGATINVFRSSLFESVRDKYDVIVFNPPLNPDEGRLFRAAGSLIRRSDFLVRLTLPVTRKLTGNRRTDLIRTFVAQSRDHLRLKGTVILSLAATEIEDLRETVKGIRIERVFEIAYTPDNFIIRVYFL